ncbi:MAG TPA: hypothetical protein DCQ08_02090, partial [Amoebophilaceae bacterium]|nr:hypothetical protein [Amoebophilaceae bacterium]
MLNRVHTNVSVGYGCSWYSHQVVQESGDLGGASIVFKEGDQFYINTGESGGVYLIQWFDGPYVRMNSYADLKNCPGHKKVLTHVKFKGIGSTLPISLSSHVDLWGKMRLGLGGALFINTLENLAHEEENTDKKLGSYTPLRNRHCHVRPFAILGFKFVENSTLSVLLDTHLGFDFIYPSSEWKCIDYFDLGVQNIGITV